MSELKNSAVSQWNFRPMLGTPCKDTALIAYPVFVTPKYDGIRCLTRRLNAIDMFNPVQVEAISRFLKRIPNSFVQQILGEYGVAGLDGELVTYRDGVAEPYNSVQSRIMTESTGRVDFVFHVFDWLEYDEELPYIQRLSRLQCLKFPSEHFMKVMPQMVGDELQLLEYEKKVLKEGYEGVMYRTGNSPYKFGRSTWNQQYLVKIKRFADDEAVVIGFRELMRNHNDQELDALGLSRRSTHREHMVPAGTLGALWVRNSSGQEFSIGSGFDEATRAEVWANQDKYLFMKVKYKYQPHGMKDAPRCPIFLGFRPEGDMDAEPLETTKEGDRE